MIHVGCWGGDCACLMVAFPLVMIFPVHKKPPAENVMSFSMKNYDQNVKSDMSLEYPDSGGSSSPIGHFLCWPGPSAVIDLTGENSSFSRLLKLSGILGRVAVVALKMNPEKTNI